MVGTGISGLLFGGGSSSPPATESPGSLPTQAQSNSWGDGSDASCEVDAKAFRKCMDDYNNDMSTCGWYLEQLVGVPLIECLHREHFNTDAIPGLVLLESLPKYVQELLD